MRQAHGSVLLQESSPKVQKEPTALEINSNYRRIPTLPRKLLKSEIIQETNGHDSQHTVNQYSTLIAQRHKMLNTETQSKTKNLTKVSEQAIFPGHLPQAGCQTLRKITKSRRSPNLRPSPKKMHIDGHTLLLQM